MTDQKDPERVVICDSETCYGERLMEYLKGHLPFPCEMELYTSAEKLQRSGKSESNENGSASLLIISEKEYEKGAKGTDEERVLVLNESGKYLGGKVHTISKYQSSGVILEMVKELAMGQEGASPGMIRHGVCRSFCTS